ncbi:Protein kinase domain-containing protein [Mycena kentingensis (nom. inval.)]|nr:Protein kinase domain-containing protein [Mycena kentingensis (nom. inval.)]
MSSTEQLPILGRTKQEMFWVGLQPMLLQAGYRLRPRHSPKWVPSWTVSSVPTFDAEDSIFSLKYVMDAIRTSNGQKVVLKLLRNDPGNQERENLVFFDDPLRRADPRNRTLPVLQTIPLPESADVLIVLPYGREFDSPPFHCRCEFVEAISQYLECLEFLHENGICHNDITPRNMLMEQSKIVPRGSHFRAPLTHTGTPGLFRWRERCSQAPNKYFFIDYDHSFIFTGPDARNTATILGSYGNYPIPEASSEVPFSPFAVDVFQLGLVIRNLIRNYPALEVFRPVSEAMLLADPCERPTPAAALAHLQQIASGIPWWKAKLPIRSTGGGTKRMLQRILLGGYITDSFSEKDSYKLYC